MKQIDQKRRSWRIVKTPTRQRAELEAFIKGLQIHDDPEIIDNQFLSEIDGMIYYSGLFRTDWETIVYPTDLPIVDNITTTLAASVAECAS